MVYKTLLIYIYIYSAFVDLDNKMHFLITLSDFSIFLFICF